MLSYNETSDLFNPVLERIFKEASNGAELLKQLDVFIIIAKKRLYEDIIDIRSIIDKVLLLADSTVHKKYFDTKEYKDITKKIRKLKKLRKKLDF